MVELSHAYLCHLRSPRGEEESGKCYESSVRAADGHRTGTSKPGPSRAGDNAGSIRPGAAACSVPGH